MDKFFIQTQHKGILMITNNMILQANGFYVFKHDLTTHHMIIIVIKIRISHHQTQTLKIA